MGTNDHRKIWHFEVPASPNEVVAAFAASFSRPVGMLRSAEWSVESKDREATATYLGRTGLGSLSASHGAGTQIEFKVVDFASGISKCVMALGAHVTRGGVFVEDVGIVRKYMQNVGEHFEGEFPRARIEIRKR